MKSSRNSSHNSSEKGTMGRKDESTTGNLPKLRVQPGTPQPPPSTQSSPVPTSSLPTVAEEKATLPQIIPSVQKESSQATCNTIKSQEHGFQSPRPVTRSGPSWRLNSQRFSRSIKQDPHNEAFYGLQCVGVGPDHDRTKQICQFGHIPLPLHKIGSPLPTGYNQTLIQTMTPTPSEVSSIQPSSNHMVSTTVSMVPDGVTSTNSTGGMEKEHFLMPNSIQKQDSWGGYKVLPAVNNSTSGSVGGSENGETLDISQCPSSHNSLSPFPLPDISPLSSSFASPRSSARLAKKRALSVSPLSSEGIDINTLIRLSPTSLFPYINGSRGSSTNTSPQPGVPYGSYGHLAAHSSSSSHNSGGSAGNRFLHTPQMTGQIYNDMAALEQGSNHGQIPPNHIVTHQPNFLNIMCQRTANIHSSNHEQRDMYMETTFKQDYHSQNRVSEQMSITSIGNNMSQTSMAGMTSSVPRNIPPSPISYTIRRDPLSSEGNMPPPPPYQEAVVQQGVPSQLGIQNLDCQELEDGEKQHICKWIDCNQLFNEQDDLVRHLEKQHIDQRKGEDFTCFWQGCPRRYKPFNARYKLLIHMRVHSGEKPNKCTFEGCTKAFSRLENLKIHLRSHTGERPYLCQHNGCSKAFSNSSDRAKHQRTHIDTKPYACMVPGCNKRYTDPSSLRKHAKNHTAKEQQVRKKIRPEKEGECSNSNMLNTCLSIQGVNNSGIDLGDSQSSKVYPGMQFGGQSVVASSGILCNSSALSPAAHGAVEEYGRRVTAGGGFNPASSGALVTPRRVAAHIGHPSMLPNLQVRKLGSAGPSMLSAPPPYQQQDPVCPPHDEVPTSGPVDMQQSLDQETTIQHSMPDTLSVTSSYVQSGSVLGANIMGSMGNPPTSRTSNLPTQHLHAVNFMPQTDTIPLVNDYAGLPCNFQERMMVGGPGIHQFHLTTFPTLEETLANLPYDAIQLQKALSNQSDPTGDIIS